MARLLRICPPGIPQHVIQRGNNKHICFTNTADFSVYSAWLKQYSKEFKVNIHAWVFMTNHVHLLATPTIKDGLSAMMQALGGRYVRYFNHQHQRTGTLWEGRSFAVFGVRKRFINVSDLIHHRTLQTWSHHQKSPSNCESTSTSTASELDMDHSLSGSYCHLVSGLSISTET